MGKKRYTIGLLKLKSPALAEASAYPPSESKSDAGIDIEFSPVSLDSIGSNNNVTASCPEYPIFFWVAGI